MSVNLKPLYQQTIVITGASSGIGLATALLAAEHGARVVLGSRNEEALAQIVERIQAGHTQAAYAVTDVSKRDDVERLAETAIKQFGGFDTWVNNAGLGLWGRLEDVSDADHRQLFDINFWGVVYGSTAAVRHLKSKGGSIINLGSVASDFAFPIQGMYSVTKHAIKGFTEALRRELQAQDAPVSVTLIQPAAIGTPFPLHAKNYTDQEPKLPPPLYAPEDVARTILFAAEHPRRALHVGGAGKLLSFLNKSVPSWLDQGSGLLEEMQLKDQASQNRHDSLWQAGKDGQVRGDQSGIRSSLYTAATVRPAVTAMAAATLGLAAGWAIWQKRRS